MNFAAPASSVELTIANALHSEIVPQGWQLARPASTCEMSTSGSFAGTVESCIDMEETPCDVQLGMDGTEFDCALAGCTYFPKGDPDKCTEIIVAVTYNGLSGDDLTKACPAIASISNPADRGADLRLRQRCGTVIPGGGLLRVRDVCPEQCASTMVDTPPDACSVPGGYGQSCAATVLAQAWQHCPEACQECAVTKRGCAAGAFDDVHTFISQIKIISNAGHLIGVAVYAAYCKTAKYRHLLFTMQIICTVISLVDYFLVAMIQTPDVHYTGPDAGYTGPQGEYTVLGVPAPYFAIFGEATQDVIDRLVHMPMLVLAAQICPDNIEGTLFAFIMGMSNMGASYAGEFGSWLVGFVGVTKDDFSSLPSAVRFYAPFTLFSYCFRTVLHCFHTVFVLFHSTLSG